MMDPDSFNPDKLRYKNFSVGAAMVESDKRFPWKFNEEEAMSQYLRWVWLCGAKYGYKTRDEELAK